MSKKGVTEDIKPSWFNPIRAAQATCRNNRGYAIVRLTLVVDKNDPVAWLDPEIEKIHPARLAGGNMNTNFLGLLLELGKNRDTG